MKEYVVAQDTIIGGKPMLAGAHLPKGLSEEKIAAFKKAGLIEEAKADKDEAKADAEAKAAAKRIDTSEDKRVEKSS